MWPSSSDNENPATASDPGDPEVASESSEPSPESKDASLARWIREVKFTDRLLGYSTDAVDKDLAAMANALEAGHSIDPDTLTDRAYPKLLRGYDIGAIRNFLEELQLKLRASSD